MVVITLPWVGLTFSWGAEFASVVPVLRSYGLPKEYESVVWIAGPITGGIIGPLSGVLSDKCQSKFGRRRPFVVGGLIPLVIGQALFGFSGSLGALADGGKYGQLQQSVSLGLGILAFWMMDTTLNLMQTPLRAIAADLASAKQQELAQALVTFWSGVGSLLTFGFSSFFDPIDYTAAYYMSGSGLLCVTVISMCFVAHETPFKSEDTAQPMGQQVLTLFVGIGRSIKTMPTGMVRICIVQVCSWLAFFCVLPYTTTYMGEAVYGGNSTDCVPVNDCDPAQTLYKAGVKMGSRASMYQAAVQLVYSFATPVLMSLVGLRLLFFLSWLVGVGAFFGLAFPTSIETAVALIAIIGIPYGAINIFPFAIVGRLFEPEQTGMMMGALNVFIVLPQLVDTTYTSVVSTRLSWYKLMLFAGSWAVLASISVLFLQLLPVKKTTQDTPSEDLDAPLIT